MATKEQLQIIGEKIKSIRTAMFVTMTENGLHKGRPMATQEAEFDGTIWFMTSKSSTKVKEISANPYMALLYGDGGVKYVSISGVAELVDDRAKIKELWSDFYKAYFKDENDPDITLIKVSVRRAEYWDYPGGKLGAYASMAVAAVTGKEADKDSGEHGVVTW